MSDEDELTEEDGDDQGEDAVAEDADALEERAATREGKRTG